MLRRVWRGEGPGRLDYPVRALNWASVGQGNPTVEEAKKSTSLALIGGMDELGAIQHGTPEEVKSAARRAIEEAGGSKFLLTPGCCVEPNVPTENLKALRQSVEV